MKNNVIKRLDAKITKIITTKYYKNNNILYGDVNKLLLKYNNTEFLLVSETEWLNKVISDSLNVGICPNIVLKNFTLKSEDYNIDKMLDLNTYYEYDIERIYNTESQARDWVNILNFEFSDYNGNISRSEIINVEFKEIVRFIGYKNIDMIKPILNNYELYNNLEKEVYNMSIKQSEDYINISFYISEEGNRLMITKNKDNITLSYNNKNMSIDDICKIINK